MALNIKRIFKIYKKNSCKFKAGDIVEVDTNGNIYVNGIIEPQHSRENDYLGGYMESRAGLTHQIEVYQYDKKYNLIAKYPSIAEANRTLGHQYKISDVCRGKRKTAKGYYWSYNLIERKEEVA